MAWFSRMAVVATIVAGCALLVGTSAVALSQTAGQPRSDVVELTPATAEDGSGLVPLPRDCKGINPVGAPEVTCCAFGYVISDSTPLAGVVVTLQGITATAVATTMVSPGYSGPHFHFSLSDLGIVAGDVITLSASYGGRSRAVVYHDLARGGQQIDLVLSSPAREDTWRVYTATAFTELHGLALDGNRVWLAGRGAASVAQLDASGTFTYLDNPLPAPIYRNTLAVAPIPAALAQQMFGRLDQRGATGGQVSHAAGLTGVAIANYGGGLSFYRPYIPWATHRMYNSPIHSNYIRDVAIGADGTIWLAGAAMSPTVDYSVTVDNRTGGFFTDLATYRQDNWLGNCVGVNHSTGYTRSRTPGFTTDSDYAAWKLPSQLTSGAYDVYAYVPWYYWSNLPDIMETSHARYQITHDGGASLVEASQINALCGWIPLGRFSFTAGSASQQVYLGDYTAGENPQTKILFDAIKWVRAGDGAEFVVDDSDAALFSRTGGVALYSELKGNPYLDCRPPNGDIHWIRSSPDGAFTDTGRMVWWPTLLYDGVYDLAVTHPQINVQNATGFANYALTRQAAYRVSTANGTQSVVTDQVVPDGCAFQSLGQFAFDAGSASRIILGNYTGESPRTMLVGDSARWTYLEERSLGGLMQRLPSGQWVTYTTDNSPILSNDVWSVLPLFDGDVWVAGAGGLSLRRADGAWMTYTQLSAGLPFTTPTALAEDGLGRVWSASRFGSGLAVYDRAAGAWQVFTPAGLPFNRIASLAGNAVGNVYIGSADGAGMALRKPNGDWLTFSPSNSGLPGGIVNGIAVAADGSVWVAATAAVSTEHTAVAWMMPGRPPVVTMNSVKPNNPVQGDDRVTFRASGSDQDEGGGDLTRFEWRVERLPGFITTSQTTILPASLLPAGLNRVTVRAYDDEGLASPLVALDTLNINAKQSWLVMLYLAGANDLDDRLASALARLNIITTTLAPNVTVAAQFDGRGPNDSARYVFRSNAAPVVIPITEQPMNQGATLSDFIAFARQQAPTANATYLVIADHGRGTEGIALDEAHGNSMMTPAALREALRQATQDGVTPIDVLHLDACLMAMTEQAAQIAPYARYLVASQNLSFSAFAFDQYVRLIGIATDGRALAAGVAISYARIISDAAVPYTISALDLGAVPTATQALAEFAVAVSATLPAQAPAVRQAVSATQHFDSLDYYTIDANDEYLDLSDFAGQVAARIASSSVVSAAARLQDVISASLVITSMARSGEYQAPNGAWRYWNLDRASGASIFMPSGWCSEYASYRDGSLFPHMPAAWRGLVQSVSSQTPARKCPSGVPPVDDPKKHKVFLPVVARGE
jgi:hypothetical protein